MLLKGKRGLIVGLANKDSIAYGCAKSIVDQGGELALTYLNEKSLKYVGPVAAELGCNILMPLDVQDDQQTDNVFYEIQQQWGELDFIIHSIAFAPKEDLHGPVFNCSREGFLKAMEISCYSFIRMAHHAAPLMKKGGTIMTVTYYGAERVVPNYNLMGPVKAALETSMKYLAAEMGPMGIRLHALSPGPVLTRAASGIMNFDELLSHVKDKAPGASALTIDQIGHFAAFLVSDHARAISGNVHYIDGGYHLLAA